MLVLVSTDGTVDAVPLSFGYLEFMSWLKFVSFLEKCECDDFDLFGEEFEEVSLAVVFGNQSLVLAFLILFDLRTEVELSALELWVFDVFGL
jgi:hypothetical protein